MQCRRCGFPLQPSESSCPECGDENAIPPKFRHYRGGYRSRPHIVMRREGAPSEIEDKEDEMFANWLRNLGLSEREIDWLLGR